MKLLIASTNKRKVEWMKYIMRDTGFELIESLEEVGYKPRISEDGSSFETNAVIKAVEVAFLYAPKGYIVVSDDGGIAFEDKSLSHDALHSHIKDKTPHDFNCEIIEKLKPETGLFADSNKYRSVKFIGACAVAYENPDDKKIHFTAYNGSSEAELRVMNITKKQVPKENAVAYYDILERVFPDGDVISFRNMSSLELMEATGALSLYNRLKHFICKNIIGR